MANKVLLLATIACLPLTVKAQQAQQIFSDTGVEGGLVVHLGCGDGELTAGLYASDSYMVHALDTDPANIERARKHIQSRGLYGNVSVDRLKGRRLPYVDNLVNLIVAEDLGRISRDEVMRVLCPNGAAYIKDDGSWTKTVKRRPDEIDEWTHYLYDSTNNAVAHDTAVGPPRHMQWVGSPRWSRHHDRMASMSAMVSAGGRIFYIFDEGSTAIIQLPPKRVLVARDAFNGVVLWKRSIPSWHTHLFPYKSGSAQLPRRLVAAGDRVYVTLGIDAPLTALDAATGKTVCTYDHSDSTQEVIASDGVLFLLIKDPPVKPGQYEITHRCMHEERDHAAEFWKWDGKAGKVLAVEADTGNILWDVARPIVPLSMAANGRGVFFHDGKRIVCLDRTSGEQKWASDPVSMKSIIPTNFGPTLVLHDDTVLFSGGDRSMTALSALTGQTLWEAKHPPSGHNSPEDLLVINGLVWAGDIAAGKGSGVFTGRHPRTGEIMQRFAPDVKTYWFHHRCYRSKATDRYLLPSRTGIEFVDIEKQNWQTHHWVRGGCIYGIMPCNGLVYAPPHSCACYIDAKQYGFNALAPASATRKAPKNVPDADRLERGPAYDGISDLELGSNDWPTYRHDQSRSGFTKSSVSAKVRRKWNKHLGGKLSSAVVAAGKVFVASIDTHTVNALDAEDGDILWSYTAGGRVDSPPTIYRGRVLFGSADGWVYCLRSSDGVLAWRFRAAPLDRRLMAFEQLESVWPVHGSVLVQNGAVYCVAGRSMFLDGGLRLLRLDPETGRKISETVLDENDPQTGRNLQEHVEGLNMPVALPDVLSSDGTYLYMRTQRFDLQGVRLHIAQTEVEDQSGDGAHLFSGGGFLDGSWFHRSYWMYGKSFASGANGWFLAGRVAPAGRILAADESSVYGYGRLPEYYRWSTPLEYHLFRADKKPEIVSNLTPLSKALRRTEKCDVPVVKPTYDWSHQTPLYARAMVLADKTLFIAGPRDIIDEEEVYKRPEDPSIQDKLNEQVAALEGDKGALLCAVSASSGKKLASCELETVPVWDGMAAANGRLYVSLENGDVLCLEGK
ncbi:MAG: PQQ-binding-like beta-propeller repeat protein [Phycisphaerae bacterium]|nr:PQQ-binding-like beta-propeller repeat protein [Phycisphaerae bacterium]